MIVNPNKPKIVSPPSLARVRAACEPQDKDFFTRFREMGGQAAWERKDLLVAIRVLSSLEDDLELTPRPENHKRVQAKAMQRVRRLLETHVGDEPGKKVEVRKKFKLKEEWKNSA